MKLHSREEMQKGLNKVSITPELLICQQSLPWNPRCERYGCDLRPDHMFYPVIENLGPLFETMTDEEKKKYIEDYIKNKDPRTNPYNPVCFRCGKRWGMCADGL